MSVVFPFFLKKNTEKQCCILLGLRSSSLSGNDAMDINLRLTTSHVVDADGGLSALYTSKTHLLLWSCFSALLEKNISWLWFSNDKLYFNQSLYTLGSLFWSLLHYSGSVPHCFITHLQLSVVQKNICLKGTFRPQILLLVVLFIIRIVLVRCVASQ